MTHTSKIVKLPSISIIIPAYNADCTILETIESVLNQSYFDIEIIVINDGSKDRTLELINSVQDNRLKVFSYKNAGVCVARNYGISHAVGEFISFIDADDLWALDKLEAQLDALKQHPEADVAYSWTYFFDEQTGEEFPGEPIYFVGNVYAELLKENFIASGSNILVRREAIKKVGEFDSSFTYCADWNFYLRLAAQCEFVVVSKHQIFYRKSTSSMSSKLDGVEFYAIAVIEKQYQLAPLEYQFLKNQSLGRIYKYSTQQWLQRSNDFKGLKTASKKFYKAVQLCPQILLEDYGQGLFRWLLKRWLLTLFTLNIKNNSWDL